MTGLPAPEAADVVILCGGRGTRLRATLSDRPKPMAEFAGRPFLSHLMSYAAAFGFRRFILCAGYKGDMIRSYYLRRPLRGLSVISAVEKRPLGTGGALWHVRRLIRSSSFLVLNGDSFAGVDLKEFLRFHLCKKAFLTLAVTGPSAAGDTGKVVFDASGRIRSFREKGKAAGRSYENAGVYAMDRGIFSRVAAGTKFSLEHDVFPSVLDRRCFAYEHRGRLTDFGTPARYRRAMRLFARGLKIKVKSEK